MRSIEHVGVVKKGEEDVDSDEVKQRAGVRENYTLREHAGKVMLLIEMDSLAALKEISERRSAGARR